MLPSLPVLLVTLIPIICNASPINRQVGISDNVYMTTQNGTDGFEQRVCSIDAVTYSDGETIPTSSPCEHCVCRPPGFACTITSCEYRPGCKAFRRSDQCCPEYQCECEKDGKIYQNGEKITDTNNPCEACYCQGGEIICAVIDCYWRNDCPPRYIDNRCCPMYDHCPPPSAQGPIRHRLPTATSTLSPISWLNLTLPQSTSEAPAVETVATSASTTTSTTTTTTTTTSTTTLAPTTSEAAVVNDAENAIVSEDIVQHDEVVAPVVPQVESLSVEPVQSNDVVETSSAAPVETTIGVEQEQGLNDEPTEPVVALNDDAEVNEPTIEPTTVPENLVSSTVIDSTTLFIAPAVVLTIAPTQVQETLFATVPAAQPDFTGGESDRLSDDATTVASSDPEVSNDEPGVTTNTPLIPEVQQDFINSDAGTTERLLDDATEAAVAVETQDDNEISVLNDDSNAQDSQDEIPATTEALTQLNDAVVNDNPTERLNDDVTEALPTESSARSENDLDSATELPVQDDEPLQATTLPSRSNLIENPDALTRTDLRPENFASEEIVTTAAPVVYADASDGTTPVLILENELRSEDVITTAAPTNIRNAEDGDSDKVLNDVPATTSNILRDDLESPTERAALQDAEPTIANDDVQEDVQIENESTLAPEAASLNDDITQAPQLDSHIQNDEATTQQLQHLNDEPTQLPLQLDILNDDATVPPQHEHEHEHEVLHDGAEDATQPTQDDEVPATQEPQEILHDEATDAPQHDSVIFSDDEATQPPQINALNEDVAVTQTPVDVQNDEATERSHAEEAHDEPALVEKAEVLSQDEVATEVPVKVAQVQPIQDVIDIILDDEVIPSKPEILNQVRETVEVPVSNVVESKIPSVDAYIEPELFNGVRNADNDTVEIVNLSAVPIEEEASVQTTQAPVELNDLEGEIVVSQKDDANPESPTQLNVEATTVQNLFALSDEPEVSTIVNDELPLADEVQGTTEGILREESGVFNDDIPVTTEREFRNEILSDPHHEEGHVHEESEGTTASSNLDRERSDLIVNDEESEVTTASSNLDRERSDLILNDEESEVTTASSNLDRERSDLIVNDEESTAATALYADEPTTSLPLYRNKVQKVVEALTEAESGENKFRLDSDAFKGSQEEVSDPVEVTTSAPASELLRSGLGSLEIVEDAPQTTLRSLEDAPAFRDGLAELTTQSPSNLRADLGLDDELEVSTQRIVEELLLNDDATEGSALQDELATTPSARTGIEFNDVVEGSGVTSSSLVQNDDLLEVTEGSGSAPRLDDESIQTTPFSVAHDDAENEIVEGSDVSASEPVTTSYAFRMDLINSLEEADANSEIIQKDIAIPTNAPETAAADDAAESTTEAELALQDEQVTTEAVSRLRLDLDAITTESPAFQPRDDVPEQSTVVSEILRAESDFVEVSTVSPSGFAAAFRDDLDADAGVTEPVILNDSESSTVQAAELFRSENIEVSTVRLADEEIEIVNDEQVTPQADEESATAASARSDNIETTPAVFADESEASTGNPSERFRTEAVEVEQQTEAISGNLQDDSEANDAATTIASVTTVNESDSTPQHVNKVGKEGVQLPEMGVRKIQPISPDLSRSNPHELRFDFQLPPEKDSTWLSRAVNQFRRLSGFGSESDSRDNSASSVKIPSRRFLLF
ncbi:unnamed protein product [Orchesella dallaii]|uniref:VWFC domain-containing protein n=1 Tax=Orchesella dallaii TaxID=48710 RepID=A0ABP1Q1U7_9HEXA